MAKFASGYIASGNIPTITAQLLSDAENVQERKLLRFQAFDTWSRELNIPCLIYVI
jgi:hypothetical protein